MMTKIEDILFKSKGKCLDFQEEGVNIKVSEGTCHISPWVCFLMDDPTVNGDSSIIDLPRSGEIVLGSEKPTVWLLY